MTMQALHYSTLYQESIQQPEQFWAKQATRIDWQQPFTQVLDYSRPPFAKWFVGGRTNLCHNAVDRWLATQADQPALIAISTEVDTVVTYTYRQLHQEVNAAAAMLQSLGVVQGDRVLIYMPMIAQAAFMMLACARLGAIHSVVFGGFASVSLAHRIDDAQPKVIVSSDAGSRAGKVVVYKPLLDEAIRLAQHKPAQVIMFDRGLATFERTERDVDYAQMRERFAQTSVPVQWVDSTHPSYILYTSGTTGKPKGVQRDTGGYAVALATSMDTIFCGKAGEAYFSTSDIGWVVGHSYIVYGPLIAGMATIMYEGTPLRPDAGVLWRIASQYKVVSMFSAPTAVRVLKKQDPAFLSKYDLSHLKYLFLAGEPLDEPTAQWISQGLGKPIIDNYWQTETGWPILSAQLGIEAMPTKFGSPSVPVTGFNVQVLDERNAQPVGPNEKGVVTIIPPLPPGAMSTVWGDDERFVRTYFSTFKDTLVYNTFDWGIRDKDGYYFILGRTDDVINVAGHRLGTREIEESIASHSAVAEVAVVGVADQLKGQVAIAFAVVKQAADIASQEQRLQLEGQVMKTVDTQLGSVARPSRVYFVPALPKTRSGKVLRRAIQAVCEGRDPGDLTTIEDPTALSQIEQTIKV